MKTFNFQNIKSVSGEVNLICSKSILQRLIIIASFLNEDFEIKNTTLNDDTKACLCAMKSINHNVNYNHNTKTIKIKKEKLDYMQPIYAHVGNSGTTMRMLATILTTFEHNIKIDAYEQMRKRDISDLLEICPNCNNQWPLIINENKNNEVTMNGNISSQYISGMIIAMCLFNNKKVINIKNPSSLAYINLTINVLNIFGFEVKFANNKITFIKRKKIKHHLINTEGDFTHAINFLVLKHFYPNINVLNLNPNSKQADQKVLTVLNNYQNISVIDANEYIDSVPILCLFFALVKQNVKFINIKRLAYKESNRINSTIETLKKFNVNISFINDYIMVENSNVKIIDSCFDSFDDHRICFLIVIGALILKEKVSIINEDAINKSYPHFYQHIKKLVKE